MDFAQRVYEVVKLIPRGCVTNYGSIGRALGAPRSARMVGWVLRNSPDEANIPAHRVVNRAGVLSGAAQFGGPNVMRDLLEAEGVTFTDEITVDMKRHYWDPAEDERVDQYFVLVEI